jgi:hypothetical protein
MRPAPTANHDLHRTCEGLAQLARELLGGREGLLSDAERALLAEQPAPAEFADLGTAFPGLLRAAQESVADELEPSVIGRAVVARVACTWSTRAEDADLPAAILQQLPPALERLRLFLSKPRRAYDPSDDLFVKDIRFAAGWMVPAGAAMLNLRTPIGRGARLRVLRSRPPLGLGLRLLVGGADVPWFEPHLDNRYLAEFNEIGWDRLYLRLAALLERRPAVAGLTGCSWLLDPELYRISPRTGFIGRRWLERGAIVLDSRTTETAIAAATAFSPQRMDLYVAGEYMPRSQRLAWLRRDILAWALEQSPPVDHVPTRGAT